jgi:hypothetical protein
MSKKNLEAKLGKRARPLNRDSEDIFKPKELTDFDFLSDESDESEE